MGFGEEFHPAFGVFGGGIEGVEEVEGIAAFGADDFPVNIISAAFFAEEAHGAGADGGAGVCGRLGGGLGDFFVRDVPRGRGLGESEAETARGIDLMVFEVLGFEPGMGPGNFFLFAELAEEPAFCDPIDFADEGLGV